MKTNRISALYNQVKRHLTWLDYIVIILTIALITFLFLFFKRQNKFITILIKVTDPNVQNINMRPLDEYAVNFQVGDKERNELGEATTEIVDVTSYRTEPGRQVTYLTLKTKAVFNPRKNQYSIKGIPVAIGQSFTFTLTRVKFEGIVVDFPLEKSLEKKPGTKIITAQLRDTSREFSDTYGVPPYLAEAVHPNDQIKNSKGQSIIKVLKVEKLPARRTVINNYSSTIIPDPILQDVFYTFEVSGYTVGDQFYMFDYIPVLIGQALPLNLPHVSIWPTVLTIE